MQHKIESYLVLFLFLFPGILFSPVSGWAKEMDALDEGLEITGLVLDETKTKRGRDFYEYFTTHWQEVEGIHYTISISELTDGIRASFVFIKVNDDMVYRNRMPRPDSIEQEARKAVSRVGVYLLKQFTVQRQLEEEFNY